MLEVTHSELRWPGILADAAAVLCREAGSRVELRDPSPRIDGWSAQHGEHPGVRRCVVSGLPGRTSAVVKARRPASPARAGNTIAREWVALTLLAELGANVGPRVLARGE